jgi:hypothetical protein
MTKKPELNRHVMLNLFQHLILLFLLSADAPFIPAHRTGFSGTILIKARDCVQMFWEVIWDFRENLFRYESCVRTNGILEKFV